MQPDSLAQLVAYFQTLSPDSVRRIDTLYSENVYFRDPFNEIRDVKALEHIFLDMFERLIEPRFTIIETIADGNAAFLVWDFDFRIKSLKPNQTRRIHGTSHIRFAADGRVNYHRDYWDAAGELYEQFPIIGAVLRWLKRRAA
jgi:steroid Delta-isomerase